MNQNLLEKIIKLLEDKKAFNITTMDIKEKSTLTDYMVIATGTSSTHIKSLADYLNEELKKDGIYPYKVEGYDSNSWILMDYQDVIVHLFTESDRNHYNLEDLWNKVRLYKHERQLCIAAFFIT